MTESRTPWHLAALAAVGLAAVLFLWNRPDDETEPTPPEDAPTAEPLEVETAPGGGEAPAVPPGDAPSFDPSELAAVLFDGGIPENIPAYDEEPAPAEPAEPAAPIVLPPAERIGPTDPRRALSRAVFWRGMLETRIEAVTAQVEAAHQSRDAPAERRARRMLERLQAQQPALAERIGELEAAVPPDEDGTAEDGAGGEPAGDELDEDESQGEY